MAMRSFPGLGHKQVSFVSPVPGTETRPQVTEKCFTDASPSSEQVGELSLRGSFRGPDTEGDLGLGGVTGPSRQQVPHLEP